MQKMKKLFPNIFNYIKSSFDDKGNFSLCHSLVALLILSALTVIYQMIVQSFNLLQLHGPILLFNIVPIFLIMTLLYFIIGKISVSFIITNTLLSVLLLINHFKIKFRDEPLNTTDFSLAKEAKNIIQNYDISVDFIVIVVILISALSFFFVAKKVKNKRPCFKISVIGILITAILSVGAYSLIYTNTRLYNSLFTSLGIFHETKIVSSKGLVYSLLNSYTEMKYQKPAGYSAEKAQEILDRYPDNKLPENTPNVIAIMSEAFVDMQDWLELDFVDDNPYYYYNQLKKDACYGSIFVPGFGGGTAQSEFEFLTGNNVSVISNSMPTAYNTHITGDAYSIARDFKELGYEAKAMHPGHPWFYNRQNVYGRLGFDSFTSKDDLEGEIPMVYGYAHDAVATNMIIDDFNRHLAENPDNGYFNFTVTIQNHGPYASERLVYNKEYLAKTEDMSDEEYHIINNYLGGLDSTCYMLKNLYDYINTIDQPTVILFFGDHLPFLDEEQVLYEKLGLDITSNTRQAFENKCTTDYLIIGNKAFKKTTTPKTIGEQSVISSNYLSVKLYQYMNVELPQRQAFLKDLMETLPILSKKHQKTSEAFGTVLTDDQESLICDYKILQYYNIKDYKLTEGENQ